MTNEEQNKNDAPADLTSVPRLALRPRHAARALGIGERLHWSKTNSGEIPHLRVGHAILYSVAVRDEWLAQGTRKTMRRWRR